MSFQDPSIPVNQKISQVISGIENGDETDFEQVLYEFEFCFSSVLQEILEGLVISPISSLYKYRILNTLYSSRESTYREDTKILEGLIASYIPDNAVVEFEVVKWLFSLETGNNHLNRLYKYLSNSSLHDLTRYNQLLSLRKEYPQKTFKGVEYMSKLKVSSRCQVLCHQFLLENSRMESSGGDGSRGDGSRNEVSISTLLEIASDEKEDYNVRADAADALHHYTDGDIQEKALSILRELGGNATNVYKDTQNVHTVDISEGMILLQGIVPRTKYSMIAKILGTTTKDPKISSSLGRIVMDTARYSASKNSGESRDLKESFTAEEILERIWEYIKLQEKETRSALLMRLTEELRDMAETCSSGHALRLINVLSGYGANVKITFGDQIASSFEGRLVARIRNIQNEDLKSEVYTDMLDHGPAFMSFYTNNFQVVIDELRHEYVGGGYVSIDEFDLAIRKAMAPYEGSATKQKIDFNVVVDEDDGNDGNDGNDGDDGDEKSE